MRDSRRLEPHSPSFALSPRIRPAGRIAATAPVSTSTLCLLSQTSPSERETWEIGRVTQKVLNNRP